MTWLLQICIISLLNIAAVSLNSVVGPSIPNTFSSCFFWPKIPPQGGGPLRSRYRSLEANQHKKNPWMHEEFYMENPYEICGVVEILCWSSWNLIWNPDVTWSWYEFVLVVSWRWPAPSLGHWLFGEDSQMFSDSELQAHPRLICKALKHVKDCTSRSFKHDPTACRMWSHHTTGFRWETLRPRSSPNISKYVMDGTWWIKHVQQRWNAEKNRNDLERWFRSCFYILLLLHPTVCTPQSINSKRTF